MAAVTGAIRTGAERVLQAADHIGDATGRFRETVGDLRQGADDFDRAFGDLRGQMERFPGAS